MCLKKLRKIISGEVVCNLCVEVFYHLSHPEEANSENDRKTPVLLSEIKTGVTAETYNQSPGARSNQLISFSNFFLYACQSDATKSLLNSKEIINFDG